MKAGHAEAGFDLKDFQETVGSLGAARQDRTVGLGVLGLIGGDVHYYAAGCGSHQEHGPGRRTRGYSAAGYELFRGRLHRISRACSRLLDDLHDGDEELGGTSWD
ncbi:hypothetical protein ACFYNO_06935 [Kitasatospora sp. NPDC006697]|uniref:hypothetical protein n=1 Tax=Kitasatospora sp. NPDC006697 TaxID=3364020 RepID=UPI003691E07F